MLHLSATWDLHSDMNKSYDGCTRGSPAMEHMIPQSPSGSQASCRVGPVNDRAQRDPHHGDCALVQHPDSALMMLPIRRSGWVTSGKSFDFSMPPFPHLGNDNNNSASPRIILKIKGGNV